jgi:hypothetical protein
LVNNLRYRTLPPEGPDVELYEVEPDRTASKVKEVVTRWINDGFCQPDEILILSPHGTKAKTSLANFSGIGEWPLVGLENRKAGELALVSINKAKGLDSLAAIMIDIERFDKLSKAQEQMNYFMGASRAPDNCLRFFIKRKLSVFADTNTAIAPVPKSAKDAGPLGDRTPPNADVTPEPPRHTEQLLIASAVLQAIRVNQVC